MATTFDYSQWNWNKIERDEINPDVQGYCINCGTEIDLNDGAIYDCPVCATVLRQEDE